MADVTLCYAIAQSPIENHPPIVFSWSEAQRYCIDPATGRPFPSARFKKFFSRGDAVAFIEDHLSKQRTGVRVAAKDVSKSISDNQLKRIRDADRQDSETLHVYTDGACINNGKGDQAAAGYGVYFGPGDERNIGEPLHPGTIHTNQRAELTAIKVALEMTANEPNKRLVIYSDSKYSMDCLNSWLPKWRLNGFRTAGNKPVKNLDLIEPIDDLIRRRSPGKFEFVYVPGHQGIEGNEEADKLASRGAVLASIRNGLS